MLKEILVSFKHLALAALFGAALGGLPANAQERTEDPSDSLAPTGRTEKPTGPAPRTPRRAEAPPASEPDDAEPAATPRAADAEKHRERTDAPWAWPWGGAVHSPSWTQDENWLTTHFWLMDVGHVQLETVWETTVARRSYDLDHFFQARARIGLLPHIELTITENATLLRGDHLRQEGNEIGARFAFWDYGTLPLNPTFEVVWHPRHGGADGYEGRGSLGGELLPGFFVVGNAFFQGETGGSHDYTWGFRGGVAYDLFHDVLRVGCEGGVSWHWNKDHDGPFRDTAPSVGPTVLFRPLALIRPEWGHWFKITASGEFGVRDDNKDQPFMKGGVLLSAAF